MSVTDLDPPYPAPLERTVYGPDDRESFLAVVRREQEERSARVRLEKEALVRLNSLPLRVRRGRERFVCYCPARRSCVLVTAYAWTGPRQTPVGGVDTLLIVARRRGSERACFQAWPNERLNTYDEHMDVACAHGTGTFPLYIPTEITGARFTADSGRYRRRISDLLGAADVAWRPNVLR